MIRKLFALAMIAVLTACSGGGDDNPSSMNGSGDQSATEGMDEVVNMPPVSNPSTTVAGEGGPPSGARAGAYVGDFGQGNGVYVVDNVNNIFGLAQAADGSARSVFGNLGPGSTYSGRLNEYIHVASSPADAGIFASGEGIAATDAPSYELNIVDGQTIEGSGESLTGSWSGQHQFQTQGGPIQLVTELSFTGTTFVGETRLENAEDPFLNPIEGTLTPFGDVSLVSYTWAGNTYIGMVFFLPNGNGDIVFLGETANVDAGNRTIASRLSRQ